MQMVAGGLEPEPLGRPLAPSIRGLEATADRVTQELEQRTPAHRLDDVGVEPPLVQTLALTEDRHVPHSIGVVRHEYDQSGAMLAPDLGLEREFERRAAAAERRREHTEERHEAVPRLPRRVVDEACVEAEGDVVHEPVVAAAADVDATLLAVERREGRDWVLDVEAEVAREMVPRPERDAHERSVFIRDRPSDGRKRPVPSSHAHGASGLAGESRSIVLVREEMDI